MGNPNSYGHGSGDVHLSEALTFSTMNARSVTDKKKLRRSITVEHAPPIIVSRQTGVHFHASFHPSQCLKATMVAMVETCTTHSCISSSMMV